MHPSIYPSIHSFIWLCVIGKAERTREVILKGMKDVQKAFAEHDLVANVRLETYEPDRYLHVPPTK